MAEFDQQYSKPKLGYFVAEDSNFVTGDSPFTANILSGLGRSGIEGYIINDGLGDLTFAISNDGGISFGSEITLKQTDNPWRFSGQKIDQIRVTWVSNTAYRIFIQ